MTRDTRPKSTRNTVRGAQQGGAPDPRAPGRPRGQPAAPAQAPGPPGPSSRRSALLPRAPGGAQLPTLVFELTIFFMQEFLKEFGSWN